MVAELGPQSRFATAFEGAFEDAESNIENDFSESMKQRYDSSVEKLSEAMQRIRELENDKRIVREGIDRLQRENEALEQQMKRRPALSADDLADIAQFLTDRVLDFEKEVSNAAERIVEQADQPDSATFQNAVKDHRAAKADLSYYTAILERVATATTSRNKG